MKLKEIAERLDCRLTGDGDVEVTGVSGLEDAGPGELTFLSNPRYTRRLKETKASAVIISKEVEDLPIGCLVSDNPYLDFARALELFYQPPQPKIGIHPTAVIAASASVGDNASIGPYAVIGERVVIGNNAVIHSHVTIYEGVRIGDNFLAHSHVTLREFCEIGDRVIVQNGTVIGSDGYGFAQKKDGAHYKIVQSGKVVIEDDVEIQANSCIDRAAVGETRIQRGSKIDNLVQVGHAVKIGENAILCAQVGIAGSTTIGNNCVFAGQVGLVNHLNIGDNVLITAQSGVPRDVPSGQKLSGYPAMENRRWLRCTAVFNRLPQLEKKIRELAKKLDPPLDPPEED
jgi:UDP-3-O-[3-hydroxymyristoyl] glucosamine N-acyltransferase